MKGHKQSLDRENKENVDIDMHKYKNQVIQSMQEGNKLRFVVTIHKQCAEEIFHPMCTEISKVKCVLTENPTSALSQLYEISVLVKREKPLVCI